MIGAENEEDAMHEYSIVVSPYGMPGGIARGDGGGRADAHAVPGRRSRRCGTWRKLMSEMLATYYDGGEGRREADAASMETRVRQPECMDAGDRDRDTNMR